MPKIKRRADITEKETVNINIDIPMMNVLIKYMRCDLATPTNKANLQKLLKFINLENYNYNPDMKVRLELLSLLCIAHVEKSIENDTLLIQFLNESDSELVDILNLEAPERNLLNQGDCKMVTDFVCERLQSIYVLKVKDQMISILESFSKGGFVSYKDPLNALKELSSRLTVELQDVSAPDSLIRSFNFSDDTFVDLINKIVNRAKKPSSVLMTGIRALNGILSPGFEGGRLYLFLGGTGKFKSGTLWNVTDQLRQFNPQVEAVEDGKRKCILFITMENTIDETVIRLFDMYSDRDSQIVDCTPDEVINILRQDGNFKFTNTDGIDIELRYYTDLEISTADLYMIIDDLASHGKKVIALVLDYIVKINAARDVYGDERLRLHAVSKELKGVAQIYDIPVITAMQINREGNGILDAAMQDSKQDLAKFIGPSHIGECWGIATEADWICMINLEVNKANGEAYLTFKRTKIRYKPDPNAIDYFNHPFVNHNGIRLLPDIMLDHSMSVYSLSTDLVSVDEEKNSPQNRKSAQSRPSITDVTTKNNSCSGGDLQELLNQALTSAA